MRRVVALVLLVLASGCGEKAKPLPPPVARRPVPMQAPPITADAIVETPVCLGFLRGGGTAYVLTTNNDPGIPEWYVRVESIGRGFDPDLTMMVKTTDPAVMKRRTAGLVRRINAFIRDEELVACTTTTAAPDDTLEVRVRGIRTTISYAHGELVVAPDGMAPVVRPQTEVTDLHLTAAYTAPTLPMVAVLMRDKVDGVVIADRAEWVMISDAAIAE